MYSRLTSGDFETKLAAVSEKENYDMKNWYRHSKKTLQWADKKRMPVDETKVRDMLRHQHIFRDKLLNEVRNYEMNEKNPTLEHGILQYANDAAHGDLRQLLTDVGVNDDSIPFVSYNDVREAEENQIHGSDHRFKFFQSALFTPLDMTDHEESFVGWNELGFSVPISNLSMLDVMKDEKFE